MIARQIYSEKSNAAVCHHLLGYSPLGDSRQRAHIRKSLRCSDVFAAARHKRSSSLEENKVMEKYQITFCQEHVLYFMELVASSSNCFPTPSWES